MSILSIRAGVSLSLALLATASTLMPSPAGAVPVANYFCQISTAYMPPHPLFGRTRVSGGDGVPCADSFSFDPISTVAASQHAGISVQPGNDLTPPSARASASSKGYNGGYAIAEGRLEYHVGLTFLQVIDPLRFTFVPVHVDAHGSATTAVFPAGVDNSRTGYGIANAFFGWSAGPFGGGGEATACSFGVDAGTPQCPAGEMDSFRTHGDADLRVGQSIRFFLDVYADAQGVNSADGDPMFFAASAFVDPHVWIDPDFMVMVDGVMVPATEVFTLEASPGISFVNIAPGDVPDGEVPLPPTLWLVGIGLLALPWRAVGRAT